MGKLFEDTKYTGLIAKLKRDGLPSYRGNQVTFSIPAAAISIATPVSPSTFVPGSSQTSTSSTQSAHAPPVGATAAPGAAIHSTAAPGVAIHSPAAPGVAVHSPAAPGAAVHSTAAPGAAIHSPAAPVAGRTAASGTGHTAAILSKGLGAATTVVPTPTAVPAKTDVVRSVTYEWAPPGINQSMVTLLILKSYTLYIILYYI